MVYFKKTGAYVLKANGQILRYQDSGMEAPFVIQYRQADILETMLDDYYGTGMD